MADTQHLPKDYLYDVRLQRRHIDAGLITRSELESHLSSLSDMKDEGELLNVTQLTANAAMRRGRDESHASEDSALAELDRARSH